MAKDEKGTKTYRIGSSNMIATEYPEVYFRFIQELEHNHPDLIRAMMLAKVSLRDQTGLDFLNLMLGTSVGSKTDMELGYGELLDALKMRITTKISQKNMEAAIGVAIRDVDLGIAMDPRPIEEIEKGKLFPTFEELEKDQRDGKLQS